MQAGDYFAEKYLIEGILGRGGMGTVYLARNIKTGMHWAIKEINRESGNDTCMPPEPYLLNRLDHPALPKLYDMVEQDGKLYMITDFIDGISLDKSWKQREGSRRIPSRTGRYSFARYLGTCIRQNPILSYTGI